MTFFSLALPFSILSLLSQLGSFVSDAPEFSRLCAGRDMTN